MKRLGKVLHVSPSGNMIVQASTAPNIGSRVVDEKIREAGFVYDVIGPVSRPYVVVKPAEGVEAENYINKPLYIPREGGKEKRKQRKPQSTAKTSRKMKAP
ncbi:MAG: H/ACA RNA-protein complex protein Gar1 [Candidatus Freyarchaeota archaeon]|nr:H/ACA RNA-protein complex protein Gar1 [Candidatus Jordarchaeia archaeon]